MTKAELTMELENTRRALTDACRILSGESIVTDRLWTPDLKDSTARLVKGFLDGAVHDDGDNIEAICIRGVYGYDGMSGEQGQ